MVRTRAVRWARRVVSGWWRRPDGVGGGRWARLLPLALIVAITVLDLLSPVDVLINRLLVAAPALAAATWDVAGTVLIGVLALVVDAVLVAHFQLLDRPASWLTFAVIMVVTAAAGYASRARRQRERTLRDVRDVAEAAQQALLHPLPDRLGPLRMESMYLAAAAQAHIGGDCYEAQRTRFGVRLLVGDVRGKGLPAVQVASVLMGSFREAAPEAPDLPALADRMEASMERYSRQTCGPGVADVDERFATALLVEVPEDDTVVHLLSCGHPPPLLIGAGGVRTLAATAPSPPFNLFRPGDRHWVETVPFRPGESLLLYTDGISEGRDRSGVFYPLAARVARCATGASPRQLIDQLRTDLLAHTAGTLDDDAAALVVRRVTVPPGPAAGGG
ncbi:PP2C family protein-serine/threonine phosphatase [Streptantibioticus cattleyicolor]|uniref:PPM-type phosphatase domain-containing protein n=1 Tax=Streptantibioticus cattleyicolor (strain ATCC 35852 / DSM 46488 / JCM 4925 / NBRC 14057 / NRRL 8057) TaxID=1003195 RepID=F8JJA2_STREN|nr:PP2C family protein-serine/threonine phosphatase [Streptantibioticus cattleyicolor]AEW98788.1 hypothetical protein SCATT_p05950 [Streptantibioticus cattleyicolor NRRL 8057 = DSM 46488]CCB72161.1 Serine phosphatase RsbU, regulator of sigma subunit [Streptantibioticus cattleyicolor NRRL 8057 = DSM 46488]